MIHRAYPINDFCLFIYLFFGLNVLKEDVMWEVGPSDRELD